MTELPANMDKLRTEKGLIDLDAYSSDTFDLDNFVLSFVFDDIVLVELIDETDHGGATSIVRNGLHIPVNTLTKAWRKGKVVLTGPNVKYAKVNDIVVFPNDKGVEVSNILIKKYGKLKKGKFLNEQRLFGVCEKCK